jgi:hypothetical protein
MSTDTVALFEVADASRALEAIRECATTTMPEPLRRLAERYLDSERRTGHCLWTPKEWKYQEPGNLVGPGGFSIRARGRIVHVYQRMRYSAFTDQREEGPLVLSAFYFMCRLVGSNEMLLMHEILPCEGADLDTICESLMNKIGPPAKNWAELSASDLFEPRCWMRLRVDQEAG